jgi:hypothetical protein
MHSLPCRECIFRVMNRIASTLLRNDRASSCTDLLPLLLSPILRFILLLLEHPIVPYSISLYSIYSIYSINIASLDTRALTVLASESLSEHLQILGIQELDFGNWTHCVCTLHRPQRQGVRASPLLWWVRGGGLCVRQE